MPVLDFLSSHNLAGRFPSPPAIKKGDRTVLFPFSYLAPLTAEELDSCCPFIYRNKARAFLFLFFTPRKFSFSSFLEWAMYVRISSVTLVSWNPLSSQCGKGNGVDPFLETKDSGSVWIPSYFFFPSPLFSLAMAESRRSRWMRFLFSIRDPFRRVPLSLPHDTLVPV